MKNKRLLLLLICCLGAQADFLAEQRQYPRVRIALQEKQQNLTETLAVNGLSANQLNILLLAYKAEDLVELWAKSSTETSYKRLAQYQVCAKSGRLGPKTQQGDWQVPEGFYHIDRFNPVSNYHLSLGINYPNSADRQRSKAKKLGGDIFIHGSCVTIGCLPLTDDKIKELYLYAVWAKNSGQGKIPLYIFPFKMTPQNRSYYSAKYQQQPQLLAFWQNLKQGYTRFTTLNTELAFTIDAQGRYIFQ